MGWEGRRGGGGVFLRAQSPVTIRMGSVDEENHSPLLASLPVCISLSSSSSSSHFT